MTGGNGRQLANGLGWFSIGLELAKVAAPGAVARLIGVQDSGGKRAMMCAYGLRELAAGIGILSQPRPAAWMWGRVAGDMVDLASLAPALSSDNAHRGRSAAATAAVLGVTAFDVYCGMQLSGGAEDRVRVRKPIIINRSTEEVYRFWHDLGNVPQFMSRIESVAMTGSTRSHWKARTPGGMTVEWDAEMVNDEPDALIGWRPVEGSDFYNSGTVRFETGPGGRGTRVTVEMQYAPPGGAISAKIAKLTGMAPGQQLERDLRRLKQILETGEVVKSDASIHSGMHAAQPPETMVEPHTAQELRPSFA